MGWFDGWFSSSSSSSSDDPLRKLDPKLREFLAKESPVKIRVAPPKAPEAKPPVQSAETMRTQDAAVTAANTTAGGADDSAVPPESLFRDGRYAHLWKTYRPLSAVEAETKSDHEKLMDVLEGYKERRAQIGRAALENCALEQADWSACMRAGDWAARFTMCRDQVRRFERCYMVQSRLLKALGYLSTQDRAPELDEGIQMHADTLYHRMLEQETAVEAARAEGRPAPIFPPLVEKPAGQEDMDISRMSSDDQKRWKEKLEKVAEEDRQAEEAAMRAELRAKSEVASKIQRLWEEQAKEREARKGEGKESVADKVSALWRK